MAARPIGGIRPHVVVAALALGCTGESVSTVGPTDADADGHPVERDCDDGDPLVYPGAPERCDGVDQDCDGAPEPHAVRWVDGDGDGWGAGDERVLCGDVPADLVSNNLDCDDADPGVHPDADEVPCAGVDTNCDGESLRPGSVASSDGQVYYSVGAALGAASDGAVISVCPGLYAGGYSVSRSVTVRSFAGHAQTTLFTDDGTLFRVEPGVQLVLDGLSLTRQSPSSPDSAVIDAELADVVVRDTWVVDSFGWGPALRVWGGSLTLDRSVVRDNQNWSYEGGAIYASADLTLIDTEVSSNTALGSDGGGLWLSSGEATLVRSHLRGNAAGAGGGAALYESVMALDAESSITDNQASVGGGVLLRGSALSGGLVADNVSSGLAVAYGDPSVVANVAVVANQAVWGGGISAYGDVSLAGVTLAENVGVWGGGLHLSGQAAITLDPSSSVVANEADHGGGAAVMGEATLSSLGAWWGEDGVDANLPATVACGYDADPYLALEVGSFSCTSTGCEP